jgi:hypothetical protein
MNVVTRGGTFMANDLLGSFGNLGGALGGLVNGLAKSGLVPKDTSEGKLIVAHSELSDLLKQEADLLLEIGRQAYSQDPSAWPQDAKLKLVQENIASARASLDEAKQAQEQAEAAKKEWEEKCRCPNCGYVNSDGMKFCQECGTPLGAAGVKRCASCDAELPPQSRFCGTCGAKQFE